MAKYTVDFKGEQYYQVEVEADSKEEAEEKAEELLPLLYDDTPYYY